MADEKTVAPQESATPSLAPLRPNDTYAYGSEPYYSSGYHNSYNNNVASTPPSLSQEADGNSDDKKIGFVIDHKKSSDCSWQYEREFGLPLLTVHDRRTGVRRHWLDCVAHFGLSNLLCEC
eukprot:2471911-Amphidinium_carterae.1